MPPTPYPPLTLTLRFASSLPDLTLQPIPHPHLTSGLSLLPEIRRHLPQTHSSLRILLISSGRILSLRDALSTSLKLPTAKKLGKAPITTAGIYTDSTSTSLAATIHATFSLPENGLSSDDLVREKAEGEELNAKLRSAATITDLETETQDAETETEDSTTHQILLGFDRLAAPSIGIPTTDITALRSHFRALVAAERGDEMPLTPMDYLVLEERWLDDAADSGGPGDLSALFRGAGGSHGGVGGGSFTEGGGNGSAGGRHYVDDVLWGNVLGFFWPLGGLFWFVRQEGAWRERRRTSVFVGVLVNLMFCVVRVLLVGGVGSAG